MGQLRIRKSLGRGRAVGRLLRTSSQLLRKRLRHLPPGALLSTGLGLLLPISLRRLHRFRNHHPCRLLRIINTRISRAV